MSQPATATSTFLFTDIEGSTRLLQQLGDEYPRLLDEHRRLITEAVERAEAYVGPLRDAEHELQQAERALWATRRATEEAPVWRRRPLTRAASQIEAGVGPLRARVAELGEAVAPYVAEVERAEARVRDAEREASIARTRERLDELARRPRVRTVERGLGIEL